MLAWEIALALAGGVLRRCETRRRDVVNGLARGGTGGGGTPAARRVQCVVRGMGSDVREPLGHRMDVDMISFTEST